MPTPNCMSGWEIPRSNFKMRSPSSTGVPVLRVYIEPQFGPTHNWQKWPVLWNRSDTWISYGWKKLYCHTKWPAYIQFLVYFAFNCLSSKFWPIWLKCKVTIWFFNISPGTLLHVHVLVGKGQHFLLKLCNITWPYRRQRLFPEHNATSMSADQSILHWNPSQKTC